MLVSTCAIVMCMLVSQVESATPRAQTAPAVPAPAEIAPAEIAPAPAVQRIRATVDPTVEFLSAVARAAGFEEYRLKSADSPYAARVDALMAPHLKHRAIELLQILRRDRGVSYDAVMSLAVHLTAPPELAERADFSKTPPRLDVRLDPRDTRKLIEALRELAVAVKWQEFVRAEQPFYETASANLETAANQIALLPWFDRVLGVRQGASYVLIAGLLNGGSNYGVGIQFLDGRPEEIRPIIGCHTWNAEGLPIFGDWITPLVAHELCHSYTNAIVDRHAALLEPAGKRLFAATKRQMERQAYGSWKTVMYETFVRACVVRCMTETEGATAGKEQAVSEVARSFKWVPALAEALGEYSTNRDRYPTLDDFIPQIVRVLGEQAAQVQASVDAAPKLLRSTPANGATDLPAGVTTLRLEFDRPMRTTSYSITGSPSEMPKFAPKPTIEQERIFTWEMTLEPGRTYRFSLNGGSFRGFKGRDGTELETIDFTLTTAPK